MSSSTWTRDELSSSAISLSGRCWRIVEAQHQVSTMKLTDSLAEQALLEGLIDDTKPPIPRGCEQLNFLLMTPFRYSASNPFGSRFRRPYQPLGVFYGSVVAETAIAEMAFHRLMFFAESPQTPWPRNAGEYTAFAAEFRSDRALDLALAPLTDAANILAPDDYSAGQALADAAREADIEIIRYPSVRDSARGLNLALLVPSVFSDPDVVDRQSWRLYLDDNGVRAICEAPRLSLAFGRDAFGNDPRMKGFVWER
jgi:hypothetical protein